jgi:hypothetical protein
MDRRGRTARAAPLRRRVSLGRSVARRAWGRRAFPTAGMRMEVWGPPPNPPQEYLCLPEPVKPVCDRRGNRLGQGAGSCARQVGLDRTHPSPGPAAAGFGGGVWAAQGGLRSHEPYCPNTWHCLAPVAQVTAADGRAALLSHQPRPDDKK